VFCFGCLSSSPNSSLPGGGGQVCLSPLPIPLYLNSLFLGGSVRKVPPPLLPRVERRRHTQGLVGLISPDSVQGTCRRLRNPREKQVLSRSETKIQRYMPPACRLSVQARRSLKRQKSTGTLLTFSCSRNPKNHPLSQDLPHVILIEEKASFTFSSAAPQRLLLRYPRGRTPIFPSFLSPKFPPSHKLSERNPPNKSPILYMVVCFLDSYSSFSPRSLSLFGFLQPLWPLPSAVLFSTQPPSSLFALLFFLGILYRMGRHSFYTPFLTVSVLKPPTKRRGPKPIKLSGTLFSQCSVPPAGLPPRSCERFFPWPFKPPLPILFFCCPSHPRFPPPPVFSTT